MSAQDLFARMADLVAAYDQAERQMVDRHRTPSYRVEDGLSGRTKSFNENQAARLAYIQACATLCVAAAIIEQTERLGGA